MKNKRNNKKQEETKKIKPETYETFHGTAEIASHDDDTTIPINIDVVKCPYCNSDWLMRKGKNKKGEQMFKCKECGRGFPFYKHYFDTMMVETIGILLAKGYSIPQIAKEFNRHTTTISNFIKKHDTLLYIYHSHHKQW
jgi:transposase-like protein